MANHFAVEGNRLTIAQTRLGARIMLTVASFGLIVGTVLMIVQKPAPGHAGTGVPPVGIIAGLFGGMVIVGLIGMLVVESHVVIDRDAGTIVMRGSRWPFKRWNIERPISEIRGVMMRRIYAGRGQSQRPVYIGFSDDSLVFAWSPAAYMIVKHLERVAQLRAFLGLPPHEDS